MPWNYKVELEIAIKRETTGRGGSIWAHDNLRQGDEVHISAPRNTYRTSDGKWLAMSGSSPALALRVFKAIGRDDMVTDGDFSDPQRRLARAAEIDEIVAGWVASKTLDEAMAVLDAAEVAAAPVYDITQLVADEQLRHREVFVKVDDDELGAMGPALRGTNGRPQQSFFTFPTPWSMVLGHLVPGRRSSPPETDGWLNGSCILFRVAALREVGPLDDRFFIFYEDTEICLRLLRHGWRSSVCPAAGMIHLEHQTVSQPATGSVMARQMLRSQWLYVRKENGRARALGVAAGTRTALALRAAKALVSRSVTPDGKPLAPQLGRLAAYAPKRPLPHEDQTAS